MGVFLVVKVATGIAGGVSPTQPLQNTPNPTGAAASCCRRPLRLVLLGVLFRHTTKKISQFFLYKNNLPTDVTANPICFFVGNIARNKM